ncbi:ATP-binding protein [Bacillus sp. JCM 19034]|uniref:ATP-binding protein n=1 Tax=Bacillus sp. JCM 19034 TaxID=1481928 RepID=UPI00078130E5|nr:ATP-binding protein [Bacillus sp. JCM 19034]
MHNEVNNKVKTKDDTHLNQLASVGQIAAGIAHEVKNPLTAVKGFLQLLQKEVDSEYVNIAQSELEDALTTLNNLLQVSKPDFDNEDYQTIHLAVELESILNLFQDKIYDITFFTKFEDVDVTIVGRKNQFKKALFNIIKNAVESIEGKGTVSITHSATDEEVIITITDTGRGIPEDKIELLGTPFFTTKENGTGMGLTQVFSVIYQHGGEVDIKSREKQGTTLLSQFQNKIKSKIVE